MAHPGQASPPSAALEDDHEAAFPWGWRPAQACVMASPVSLLRLQGPDSLRFLHGQTSQAIELAPPGQWLSTCCITPTARLRALAEVLVSEDGAWLVIREGDGTAVRQALDRVLFPADAVQLGPLLPGLLLEPLPQGADRRAASEAVSPAAVTASPATGAPSAAVAPPSAAGVAASSVRCWRPLQGAEGFWLGESLLLLDPAAAEPLEAAARSLLALPRLEGEERERWRIRIGWPSCPAEVNDDTNPFELGLAPRVSLNKGCYVGQETLAKLATYDGVRRQLRRWFVAGGEGPAVGAALSLDGERAGLVSSALALPAGAGWIGLALVRRSALEAGALEVEREAAPPLRLQLSLPDGFVAPPQGAAGQGRSAR